jgi:serine/threonine protein kinase
VRLWNVFDNIHHDKVIAMWWLSQLFQRYFFLTDMLEAAQQIIPRAAQAITRCMELNQALLELTPNFKTNSEEFENIKSLGQGRYSFVRLCKHIGDPDEKPFVVKFIVRAAIRSWSRINPKRLRIPLEISILSSIGYHRNILRMLAYDQDPFFYRIISEYVPGTIDLFEFVEKSIMIPESRIKHIIWQVLDAIKYLHDLDILHRDIKVYLVKQRMKTF